MSNSPSFAGVGLKDRDSRVGFRTDVIVEGNLGNLVNISPNTILINFAGNLGQLGTAGTAPWVEPLAGMALRATTSLVVIDFVMVVWFAYITYDDAGNFDGWSSIDKKILNYFKNSESCFAV